MIIVFPDFFFLYRESSRFPMVTSTHPLLSLTLARSFPLTEKTRFFLYSSTSTASAHRNLPPPLLLSPLTLELRFLIMLMVTETYRMPCSHSSSRIGIHVVWVGEDYFTVKLARMKYILEFCVWKLCPFSLCCLKIGSIPNCNLFIFLLL